MKVTVALIIAIALVAALLFSLQQGPSQDENPVPQTQPAEETVQKPAGPAQVPSAGQGEVTTSPEELVDEQRDQQITQTKAKLDALMLEYNENLKNPQAKKELEAQISVLMDEYNALILPVAMAKMKQTATPKT